MISGSLFFYQNWLTFLLALWLSFLLTKAEKIIEQIKIEIKDEEKALSIMTAPQIKFFLCSLKKGDINDIKYQKLLINTFVNKIYLYDDRITIIFNASDTPYEIKDKLLSDIDVDNKEFIDEKGLFIDCKGPPAKKSMFSSKHRLSFF